MRHRARGWAVACQAGADDGRRGVPAPAAGAGRSGSPPATAAPCLRWRGGRRCPPAGVSSASTTGWVAARARATAPGSRCRGFGRLRARKVGRAGSRASCGGMRWAVYARAGERLPAATARNICPGSSTLRTKRVPFGPHLCRPRPLDDPGRTSAQPVRRAIARHSPWCRERESAHLARRPWPGPHAAPGGLGLGPDPPAHHHRLQRKPARTDHWRARQRAGLRGRTDPHPPVRLPHAGRGGR